MLRKFRSVFAIGVIAFVSVPVLAADPVPYSADEIEAAIMAGLRPISLPTRAPALSSDCTTKRIAGDSFRRPLRGLRNAVRERRAPRVLAIGSSSTVGVGASRPSNAYIARLEDNLEKTFSGFDFDVVGRGISGEIAEGQSARMKDTIAEVKPDLVLWQVGTNDAIRHVDVEAFKDCLRRTLDWLNSNRIDVVLVDPQYSDALTRDEFYEKIVAAVADVARERKVLLVDRFEAMRELSRNRGDRFYLTSDNLHLNDNGHRCMAEQLARAIVAGVLMAENDSANLNPALGRTVPSAAN
ncbi:MAG TPA: GDSL-type esterase/lipase family protein [Hyphomicrobiaceae bacterium]|nr:GDSL-type esterase/lipase family protein [Hyphomicrobiaceae bacterium]